MTEKGKTGKNKSEEEEEEEEEERITSRYIGKQK